MIQHVLMTLRIWCFLWYQNPQGVLWAANIGMIVLGGLGAWIFLARGSFQMPRAPYAFWTGAFLLALALGQSWWLWYLPALKTGLKGLFLVADLASLTVFGAGSMVIGMARARDAYGSPGKGWYVLVPFMNLVLLLRNSQTPHPYRLAPLVATVGVVMFVAARVATQGIEAEVTARSAAIESDPQALAALQVFRVSALGLDKALDQLLAAERPKTKVGPTLEFTSVARDGNHMTYVYTVDEGDITSLDATYRRKATTGFCGAFMPYLNLGASVAVRYNRTDGAEVETLNLSLVACTT